MIRILKIVATLVLCAVCFSLPIWSQSDAVSKGGRISLKQSTVDVGNVKGDSIVEGKFTVYNIGDQPVEILKIFSDCSCAVASFSSDSVEPGDSMTFVAKYDPRGYKYSRFRHRFRIRSTASNSYISAVMTGSIKHDKQMVFQYQDILHTFYINLLDFYSGYDYEVIRGSYRYYERYTQYYEETHFLYILDLALGDNKSIEGKVF